MSYKTFENTEAFIKELFVPIDLKRTIMLLNNPDVKFKASKNKSIKKVFSENLHYVFPESVYQVESDVKMSFTRFDPKFVGQISDFWFLGVNVYPTLSAPIFIVLFLDTDDNLCYYVPTQGNTFNVILGKPFGQDVSDVESCKVLCGCTIEELSCKPEKYQNLDLIRKDICETFGISAYSMLLKTDVNESTENWFEFTKTKNENLL